MARSGLSGSSRARACVIAAFVSVIAPWLSGCGCTGVNCASGATLAVDVPDGVPIPDGTTVTACFNDACVAAVLPSTAAVRPGTGLGFAFPAGSGLSGTLWAPDVADHGRVQISWYFADDSRLRAGDRYSAV